MFGKALDTYKKMGIAVASVMAAITVGPYAWARFGFQPGSYEMQAIRGEFKTFLQTPPIGLSGEKAEEIVRKHGDTVHGLSGVRVQVEHLNPKTGQPEMKMIKAGKDFFLYSSGGHTRGWSGEADLRKPEVVARWQEQADKGVKAREKAIANGTQNARNGSPGAVTQELRELGDRDLADKLSRANMGRVSSQQPSAWNSAIDALKKAAKDNPSKRATYNNMLERLKPFHDRVATRHTYTREGRREFEAQQRMAARRAAPVAAAPAAPAAAATNAFIQRAARFGTTPDQEREVERRSLRRIDREQRRRNASRRGETYSLTMDQYANRERRIERGQMQADLTAAAQQARERANQAAAASDRAAAQANVAARTAARPVAPPDPATAGGTLITPQEYDAARARAAARKLVRQGQAQTRAAATPAPAPAPAPARAPAPPDPATPEERAAKFGTTVAQEKRIERIAQAKKERELLKRREARAMARFRNRPAPEFVPIRQFTQEIRTAQRAALRR